MPNYSRISKTPIEVIRSAVSSSISMHEALKKIGYVGSNVEKYRLLRTYCEENDISTSHLKTQPETVAIRMQKQNEQVVQDWLNNVIGFSPVVKGWQMELRSAIRDWLLRRADNQCEECGWHEIHSKTGRSPLQIHHEDGDAGHNRPDNLKILCPNCHSLTPNFGRLNRSKRVNRYAH